MNGTVSRYGVLAWLVAAFLAPAAGAQVSEAARQAFQQGNEHYRSGRYADALAAYREAEDAGLSGAALHFNRGNVFYRTDRLGAARLAYERAARLRPDDPRIRHNLAQLRQRLPDTIAERPDPLWTRWWQAARQQWGALGFFFVGLALYLGALGLLGAELCAESARTWRRILAGTLAGGGALLIGAAFLASWQAANQRQAVVTAPETSLRTRPGNQPDGERVRKLREGVLVDVLRRDSTWTRVQLPNGRRGWLPASAMEDV